MRSKCTGLSARKTYCCVPPERNRPVRNIAPLCIYHNMYKHTLLATFITTYCFLCRTADWHTVGTLPGLHCFVIDQSVSCHDDRTEQTETARKENKTARLTKSRKKNKKKETEKEKETKLNRKHRKIRDRKEGVYLWKITSKTSVEATINLRHSPLSISGDAAA